MVGIDFQPRTRVVFSRGAIDRAGALAGELHFRHSLVIADPGIASAGHVGILRDSLSAAGIATHLYTDFGVNPDSRMVARGRDFAASLAVDSIVAIGGGSSLDCAKGINFLLTNGGRMADYRGYGKATRPLLPMLGIPTTAGTGSEAQSYAVISDADTHMKMACGDPTAAFRVAILDPDLTASAPWDVTASAGFDAIAHAVETSVTTRRTALSDLFAERAWTLLSDAYPRVLADGTDPDGRSQMLLGSHFAGTAIEQSMLGAAHACANPLTARFDVVHAHALSILLPHVVRWNGPVAENRYAQLMALIGRPDPADPAGTLARLLEDMAAAAHLPRTLSAAGVPDTAIPELAELAAEQWTGTFNPRPFDAAGAQEIYRNAL
jgi:alcohol dehydrogenase